VVVAPVPEPFELGGIEVMPPQKFLGELGRWL
jgi:hypothetical protein